MSEVTSLEGEGICIEVIEKLTKDSKSYNQVTIKSGNKELIFYDWNMISDSDMEGETVKFEAETNGRYNTLKEIWES